MGTAISLAGLKGQQVVYDSYYSPLSTSRPREGLEVHFSLLSGQVLTLTLSRKATVQAARRQIAGLCCVPDQAVHVICAGEPLPDELRLVGLEQTLHVIFNSSRLKGPVKGHATAGIWHGLQARALLLNPVPRGSSGEGTFHIHEGGMQSFLYTSHEIYSLSATKKPGGAGRNFAIRIEGLEKYRARIHRPLSHKAYALYDDATSSGAREMGVLYLRSKRRVGPSDVEFVMPRVNEDGAAACLRASSESICQRYDRGRVEHLQVLTGSCAESRIELRWQDDCIFEAQAADNSWAVSFQHPLSHFQAFGIMIGMLDNACLASFHK
ncbi:unnamed protein product [Effrenium voratum]|uniref:Ubiquitin-like domain-containing protein n=1 Tax=Effrenium voratum TaxID=2562239 RepID=A0AA36JRU0_9DINO|nr:unnamed protein product [Effrenium voratum]CAJ1409963.1 unnamed protein product [Effrenium voratum]|eukprot:CAMPEP_0181428390 /NCGR_PEP_ID=MMETSP1110-20121109/16654_1 /TAXON_ID=174948 /ORGANISM="Symbiodinium sp., Strain CCMP421" /LENGTH=323 /DNA_ID=CAMNT_0023551615 /DNA_START=12 /DNA_END=983 /DNA_ORIENTATION=+